jgi:hypothetical protein
VRQKDVVKIHNIDLSIKRLEVIVAKFPKTIKLGLALVIFGSSGLAIHNPIDTLSNIVYNLIFISLLGFGSILFIIGTCKGIPPDTS